MRRFELVEGSSSKFWEVAVDGSDVTVRFGRIGTAGQTKTKSFADAAAARREHDKLVSEKTGKGYAQVGVAAGAPLAAAPAAPAAPAASPAPLPAPAPSPSTDASAIDWPQGGFQWSAELEAELPVVRGIHVPATRRDPFAQLPLVFENQAHSYQTSLLGSLDALTGGSTTPWDGERSARLTTRERLAGTTDPVFWRELCAQALVCNVRVSEDLTPIERYHLRSGLRTLTEAGAAMHGLAFMVERAVEVGLVALASHSAAQFAPSMLAPLRLAIAQAEVAVHDAAMTRAEALRARGDTARLIVSHLFPHRQDWAEACVAERPDDPHQLLKECVLSAEVGRFWLRNTSPWLYHLYAATLLHVRLHDAAALDLLTHLVAKAGEKDSLQKSLALLARLQTPASLRALAGFAEAKEARAVLEKLAERWPAAVLLVALEQAFASRSRLVEGWAVRLALRDPAVLAQAQQALGDADRARLQALLAALSAEEAPADALPPLLREPPWLRKARASELPTLALAAPVLPERITTLPEVNAREAAIQPSHWLIHRAPAADREDYFLAELKVAPAARARVLAGEALRPGDVDPSAERYWFGGSVTLLLVLPERAALALWNGYPAQHWSSYENHGGPIRALLARHGNAALDGLVRYAQSRPIDGLALALDVDSVRLVPTALHALRSLKKAKPVAIDWLRAHADTALAVALVGAFGAERAPRDDARFALRWFVANGFADAARRVAAELSPELPAALQALLDADPLLVLPARMPKLPAFFVPASFRRPALNDGGVIGADAALHVGSMLAISKLEAPYAGLAVLRQSCTTDSLAEFVWDLFEAWLAAGAPSKEAWAFTALGLLGNDETARRLAPRIREWPGESAHLRAVAGLDLLAAIGSDVALMHLHGIASKVKFKALQDRAREKIDAVAEARGLSAAELADRLVPDLGLDETGTLVLDFGPRRFLVAFDEALKPFVKDAQGLRLKDLPKPQRSDDAALAEAATERWKALKKDAKAVASLQVTRLELAMVDRRRWRFADFRLFFLDHPLMRHLVTRLAWGVYDAAGVMQRALRIAEDFTLADENDELTSVADDAVIGIAHVLEMPEPLRAAFGQQFADYEIMPPFRQLGRETYALTADEARGSRIERFKNKAVATGSVLGLANRGWERGAAQDAGFVGWYSKPVGDGLEAQLELDPGTVVGDPSYEPKQTLPALELRRSGSWDTAGLVPFSTLHPIVASELLRDVELLAPFKE